MKTLDAAKVCRALGDENRLNIVMMLGEGERCACKLLEKFNISQPTLSHHMKILCGCGIVKARRDGKWTYYSLDNDVLASYRAFVDELCCGERSRGECCGK